MRLAPLAALTALVRAGILSATINGEKKGPADLAQNRIGTAQFRRVAVVMDGPMQLSGDPELPGFVLDLTPIW